MSSDQITILHYAAPPVIGGVESTIYHHTKMFLEHGFQVQVIAGKGGNFVEGVKFRHLPQLNSRYPRNLEIGKQLKNGEVSPEFFQLRDEIYQALSPFFTSGLPVIVHNAITLHKNLPFTAALHQYARQGKPLIAWCHDFAWQDRLYLPDLHPGYPWDLLSTVWESTRYVVVSQDRQKMLAELLRLPEEQISVITPGVDAPGFLQLSPRVEQIARRLDLFSAAPILLLPARITRRKNIEFALHLLAELTRDHPQAKLLVTGPPGPHNPANQEYLNELLALRAELNLQDRAVFIYEQGDQAPMLLTDDEIAEFYRLADVLFFPSKREGFGIPVLEAGLARMPVFVADIPPARESAGEYAKFFSVKNGSPEQVAADLSTYLAVNREYQLRKRVLQQFTWQAIFDEKILPLITKVQLDAKA
jgi:glycosyltransferase involved in cell wall biosynthesis